MNSDPDRRGARREVELDAYRDGELSPWRRWLVGRRVARDPALQRRLAVLETLGGLLREEAESTPPPDLWDGIRARLATAPRPEPLHGKSIVAPAVSAAPAWLGAAFATAVVVIVMATSWLPGDAPSVASVRWLDSKGKPVMVLRDDLEATIIWVIQKPKRTTGGGLDAMV
jgi:anti-sigma factor RsiW